MLLPFFSDSKNMALSAVGCVCMLTAHAQACLHMQRHPYLMTPEDLFSPWICIQSPRLRSLPCNFLPSHGGLESKKTLPAVQETGV